MFISCPYCSSAVAASGRRVMSRGEGVKCEALDALRSLYKSKGNKGMKQKKRGR